MQNVFSKDGADHFIQRIQKLSSDTPAEWGKMSVEEMLAHCNITYELAYEKEPMRAKGLKKLFLNLLVKPAVVGAKPYPKNSRTAPVFIVKGEREFSNEKSRLIDYINKTVELGADHFEQRESASFGPLSIEEWNNLFSKHLDHHMKQFGV